MNLATFESSVFFATVRIASSSARGSSIGTGFLLRASFDGSPGGQRATLLISNRHVFADPNNRVCLQFHKRDSGPNRRPALGELVSADVVQLRRDAIYVQHPSQEVDLACLVANAIEDPQSGIFALTVPRDMLATYEEPDIFPGDDVWFVGYPANCYDTVNNLPIMRHGYIATIPTVNFEGGERFVIDAQVFPGSSGSPVFAEIGGKKRLIGVVAETMIDYQNVQGRTVASMSVVERVLVLGIVLKSTVLPTLIDTALDRVRKKG